MGRKLKSIRITLTPQISELLEAEVTSGRFANISAALSSAALRTFAEDPAAELRGALQLLDESDTDSPPSSAAIAGEIKSWCQ